MGFDDTDRKRLDEAFKNMEFRAPANMSDKTKRLLELIEKRQSIEWRKYIERAAVMEEKATKEYYKAPPIYECPPYGVITYDAG